MMYENIILVFLLTHYISNASMLINPHPFRDVDLTQFLDFSEEVPTPQSRIASGQRRKPGDIPYHVQIRYLGAYLCGGALALYKNNVQIVVTAGQCVTQKDPSTDLIPKDELLIIAGRSRIDGKHPLEQYRCVSDIIRHADFRRKPYMKHDFAVILLDEGFRLNNLVNPINLTTNVKVTPAGTAIISGWGLSGPSETIFSTDLRVAGIQTVPNKRCSKLYSATQLGDVIHPYHFCVGHPGSAKPHGACAGDFGSPAAMILNNTLYLIGVSTISSGRCGNRIEPSIYMDLSFYIPWIPKVMPNGGQKPDAFRTSPNFSPFYRIVGGSNAKPGWVPFHAQVKFKKSPVCSGALVHDQGYQFILTAGSCVTENSPKDPVRHPREFEVVVGALDRTKKASYTQSSRVRRVVRHPGWKTMWLRENDIAILILERQFVVTRYVVPADLPPVKNFYPHKFAQLSVSGWGVTSFSNGKQSNILKVVKIPVMDKHECHKAYDNKFVYQESLCAYDRSSGGGKKSPFVGDEGAPALITDDKVGFLKPGPYLGGIFSRTDKKDGSRGKPAIFTRVSFYLEWIKSNCRLDNGPNRCRPA